MTLEAWGKVKMTLEAWGKVKMVALRLFLEGRTTQLIRLVI